MSLLKNLWVTGYRAYELEIFQDNDPKQKIIMNYLSQTLFEYCDQGLEWVLTGGQSGVEQYSVSASQTAALADYQLQVAVMLPFTNFAQRWSENKQTQFQKILQQADYHNYVSQQDYQNPSQFRLYQQFMLQHTQGALLIYDPEYPGKSQYDWQAIQNYQQKVDYQLQLVTMDDLQDFTSSQTDFPV
ncbi:DUF1273 family protein [Lactobacillus sp. DCY120]|uniref:DUF1273 family protein n=1 Tax=Bombilactobacillus apium TaxID=2675299 RepID=A0A850QYP9_9LACO|nr:SLOG family protein [Bombilactobacillus apium]NVY95813.1 DUF1273 family protein [Bombilactobacillus apium]